MTKCLVSAITVQDCFGKLVLSLEHSNFPLTMVVRTTRGIKRYTINLHLTRESDAVKSATMT